MNRYYYNGQYVGYVVAADPTPTPTEAPQNEAAEASSRHLQKRSQADTVTDAGDDGQ